MQLLEFSLISPVVESGSVLKADETAIPTVAIEQAISDTEAREDRKRALPSHLVVCLVIAMSLWSKDCMRTVLKNLVDGLTEAWVKVGKYWLDLCKSSITEARQRVGSRVMNRLFHQVVRPLGTAQTPGVFLGGLRVMPVDGTVLDVPEMSANARVFGYPQKPSRHSSRFDQSASGTID